MTKRTNAFIRWFCMSACVLLLATATAKVPLLVSGAALGGALARDAVFPFLTAREAIAIAAILEVGVALRLCRPEWASSRQRLWWIAWITSLLALYRTARALLPSTGPCPCLGAIPGSLGLSDRATSAVMWCILSYLFIGSVSLLAMVRRNSVEPTSECS